MSTVEPLLPYEWPGSFFIGEEEMEAVSCVIRSRSPFRFYGHDLQGYVQKLEDAYCARTGQPYALAVNSGTAALSITLSAMDVGPGDEVLLPGYLWVSCIAAIVRAGAIPRLVEVDDTFCMDPNDLEQKITEHSKVVMVVHMSGMSGDIERIAAIARKHGLLLLEDCAQANGALFRGRPLGGFGDAAIFSFQLNKNVTAGEGGMLVCADKMLYDRAVAFHDLGYPRNEQGRLITDNPDLQLWGQGSRMSELSAAMMVAQEHKLDEITAAMRERNHYLYKRLSGIGGMKPRQVVDPQGDSGAFALLIWPDAETCRAITHATREAGVRPGPLGLNNVTMQDWGLHLYYNNLSLVNKRGLNSSGYPWTAPENVFAADYAYGRGSLPYADQLFDRTSVLQVPPILDFALCDRIVEIFSECAEHL